MLVEITVKSLKEAATKLPTEGKLSAIDEGIRVSAKNNDGGVVTVSDVTANRVNELLGVKPVSTETVAETGNPNATPAGEQDPADQPDPTDTEADDETGDEAA